MVRRLSRVHPGVHSKAEPYISSNNNNRDLSDLAESWYCIIENSALELNLHISIRFNISIRST